MWAAAGCSHACLHTQTAQPRYRSTLESGRRPATPHRHRLFTLTLCWSGPATLLLPACLPGCTRSHTHTQARSLTQPAIAAGRAPPATLSTWPLAPAAAAVAVAPPRSGADCWVRTPAQHSLPPHKPCRHPQQQQQQGPVWTIAPLFTMRQQGLQLTARGSRCRCLSAAGRGRLPLGHGAHTGSTTAQGPLQVCFWGGGRRCVRCCCGSLRFEVARQH